MKRITTLATLGLAVQALSLGVLTGQENTTQTKTGVVKKVNASAKQVVVMVARELTFTVTEFTKIVLGDEAKQLADVTVGARVTVEGAGRLRHYDLLKGKPYLMVSGNAKSRPRAQQISDAAKAAGAKATLIVEDVGKHDFPVSAYPAVREWLRGPATQ